MAYHLDHNQFEKDLKSIGDFLFGWMRKPFDPKPKIVEGRKIGAWENFKDRFMLSLVDLGPMKVFKTIVVTIVGIWLFFAVFQHADPAFKIITALVLFFFYIWVFSPELKAEKEILDKKKERGSAHTLLDLHDKRKDIQGSIIPTAVDAGKNVVTGAGSVIGGLFGGGGGGAAPAEKPKGK